MIEDKALVTLVGLVVLALAVGARMWKYGARNGAPHVEGLALFPAWWLWLGAPVGTALSVVASIVAALSVPVLVYGLDAIRGYFVAERGA